MPENHPSREIAKRIRPYLVAVGLLGLSTIAANYMAHEIPIPPNIMPMLLATAGTFHVAGRVADTVSTIRLYKKVNEVEGDLGIDVPFHESASILPARPTAKDLLNPVILALQLGEAIPLAIWPPYGFIRGIQSFGAAAYNNRSYKSLVESTS